MRAGLVAGVLVVAWAAVAVSATLSGGSRGDTADVSPTAPPPTVGEWAPITLPPPSESAPEPASGAMVVPRASIVAPIPDEPGDHHVVCANVFSNSIWYEATWVSDATAERLAQRGGEGWAASCAPTLDGCVPVTSGERPGVDCDESAAAVATTNAPSP